jgi:hypothetical protein
MLESNIGESRIILEQVSRRAIDNPTPLKFLCSTRLVGLLNSTPTEPLSTENKKGRFNEAASRHVSVLLAFFIAADR